MAYTENNDFIKNWAAYKRFRTREVMIGEIPLGGDNPIRIQSMTTTDTMNTRATVNQSIQLFDSGCDYVRITAPSMKEAENLRNIKKMLVMKGYTKPLVADIHFTPNAAEIAARIVEKVRINPGNYADKKAFKIIEYSDLQYEHEIDRIRKKVVPLIKICKEYGTAMRIGTNHGSLSDRIMSRYGDSPAGMVESALEFVRICRENDFHEIVLSMKSSNPQVMVYAYRLLIAKMLDEGMDYPLHLGVTEAGDGIDGRIKSSSGIGSLLVDGIGDTVRVSLTEDSVNEAPVAIEIVERATEYRNIEHIPALPVFINPFGYQRRISETVSNIGGVNPPLVMLDLSSRDEISHTDLMNCGFSYNSADDKWNSNEMAADIIYTGKMSPDFSPPGLLKIAVDAAYWADNGLSLQYIPLFIPEELITIPGRSPVLNIVRCNLHCLENLNFEILKQQKFLILLEIRNIYEARRAFYILNNTEVKLPVILSFKYEDKRKFLLASAADFGSLLMDGFGDGIMPVSSGNSLAEILNIAFTILQAARVRISKTEYIACPSCGRTLFDLVEVTAKVRNRTQHLKGLKIAVMGCIVNGPGEMADADYGYVGSGPGRITLYRGKEIVKKNISDRIAVDELIGIISEDGKWVEP